ncbi:hypothetical protein HELRODRAFT_160506 [Helobdella robusta]|uniref:Uncharacterized protein n=1 Tax=Helobdella robusta TaxID=6412 RepID=T1EQC2_HELRO|nr:hypothetical protein HELRODRAFT_160506 [Helobdella robusta]ESO06341.1 hypothetical protein HELRODRAFT_160506 [Helobdella robusta]
MKVEKVEFEDRKRQALSVKCSSRKIDKKFGAMQCEFDKVDEMCRILKPCLILGRPNADCKNVKWAIKKKTWLDKINCSLQFMGLRMECSTIRNLNILSTHNNYSDFRNF